MPFMKTILLRFPRLPGQLLRPWRALWGPAAGVSFANIAEGTAEHGSKAYLSDQPIPNRFCLVIPGSTPNNVTPSTAPTDIPLGVCTDAPEAANLDVPVNVEVFGACRGTKKVLLSGTVNAGDMLQSNGDGGAIKLLTTPTMTFYAFGRALQAGVAGDTIEFTPTFPLKFTN